MKSAEIEARLNLFSDLLLCCHNLYLWEFDSGFHLIRSNCPQEEAVQSLFHLLREDGFSYDQSDGQSTPILLTNDIGLLWITQPQVESGETVRLHVLGPLFLDDVSPNRLEAQLGRHGLSRPILSAAKEFLRELPVISLSRVFEYALMLHHCVTGERIAVSDLRYEKPTRSPAAETEARGDAHGTYAAEREMVRMVREGDVENFKAHMDKMGMIGAMGEIAKGDPLRKMKNAVITCLVLFSRAAIEGGLDPEVSYTLSDRYFQSIEACTSVSELAEIAKPMQEDYIRRVHQCRVSPYSRQIQACLDYISLHLEDPLDLPTLARQSGYAEYYLSRKFKTEVGLAPSDYIRRQRLERAAHLLRSTQADVQKIGARLQFGSQSYFTECFRKQFGVTPTAYRLTDEISL